MAAADLTSRQKPMLFICLQVAHLGSVRLDDATMARRVQWLKAIQEWQEEFVDSLTAREFVDGILDDLLGQSVFVFTPSGHLLRLPKVVAAAQNDA